MGIRSICVREGEEGLHPSPHLNKAKNVLTGLILLVGARGFECA